MGHGTAKGVTGVATKHDGNDFLVFEKTTGSGAVWYFGLADGTGIDVVFRGATAGAEMTWDESANALLMDGIDLHLNDGDFLLFGDLAAGDITMNFDGSVFELESAAAATSFYIGADSKLLNTVLKGTLTVGKAGTSHDIVIHSDTSGADTTFDQDAHIWLYDGIDIQLEDGDFLNFGDGAAGDITMNFDGSVFELESAAAATSFYIGATSKLLNTVLKGTLTVGVSGTSHDIIIHSDTADAQTTFDQDEEKWIHDGIVVQLNDTDELRFGDLAAGDITMNFDAAVFELQGAAAATSYYIGADSKLLNTVLKGTFTLGKSGTGHDIVVHSNAADAEMTYSASDGTWTFDGIDVQLEDGDELRFGDLAAGDVTMNFDSAVFEMQSAAAATSFYIGGTSKLFNTVLKGTFTHGVSGTGHDIIVHSNVAAAEMTYSAADGTWTFDGIDIQLEDSDELRFGDAAAGDILFNFDGTIFEMQSAASNTTWDIGKDSFNINTTLKGTLTVGKSGTGHDVILHGNTGGAEFFFDYSDDILILDGITLQLQDTDELWFGDLVAGDVRFGYTGSQFEMDSAAAATSWIIGGVGNVFNIVHTGSNDMTGTLEMQTTSPIQFRDSALKIYSSGDAQLDLVSDGVLKLDGKITHNAAHTVSLSGTKTLAVGCTRIQFLDPKGASRIVVLPTTASSDGIALMIANVADAGESLSMQDAGGTTICDIDQYESGYLFCNGVAWRGGTLNVT